MFLCSMSFFKIMLTSKLESCFEINILTWFLFLCLCFTSDQFVQDEDRVPPEVSKRFSVDVFTVGWFARRQDLVTLLADVTPARNWEVGGTGELGTIIPIYIYIYVYNVGSTIVNPPPQIFFFFFFGGVASQLLIFGPNSPHKSKRQIKTIQPQLNE